MNRYLGIGIIILTVFSAILNLRTAILMMIGALSSADVVPAYILLGMFVVLTPIAVLMGLYSYLQTLPDIGSIRAVTNAHLTDLVNKNFFSVRISGNKIFYNDVFIGRGNYTSDNTIKIQWEMRETGFWFNVFNIINYYRFIYPNWRGIRIIVNVLSKCGVVSGNVIPFYALLTLTALVIGCISPIIVVWGLIPVIPFIIVAIVCKIALYKYKNIK